MKLKPLLCDCPTTSTLERASALYRRTYWRSFFSRRARRMLERNQLAIRRMLMRRCGCRWNEPGLRGIYQKAGRL